MAATRSENPEERLAAARVLASLSWGGDEFDVAEVAGAVMAALGERGLPTVIAALVSDDPVMRRLAIYAVAHLGPRAAPHLGAIVGGLERFPTEMALALVAIGEAASGALVEALRHPSRDVRLATLSALDTPPIQWPANIGRTVLGALLAVLAGDDQEVSRRAADTLASCGCAGDDVVAYYEENLGQLHEDARDHLRGVIDALRV